MNDVRQDIPVDGEEYGNKNLSGTWQEGTETIEGTGFFIGLSTAMKSIFVNAWEYGTENAELLLQKVLSIGSDAAGTVQILNETSNIIKSVTSSDSSIDVIDNGDSIDFKAPTTSGFVEKTGDTMTGSLTTPQIITPLITSATGAVSLAADLVFSAGVNSPYINSAGEDINFRPSTNVQFVSLLDGLSKANINCRTGSSTFNNVTATNVVAPSIISPTGLIGFNGNDLDSIGDLLADGSGTFGSAVFHAPAGTDLTKSALLGDIIGRELNNAFLHITTPPESATLPELTVGPAIYASPGSADYTVRHLVGFTYGSSLVCTVAGWYMVATSNTLSNDTTNTTTNIYVAKNWSGGAPTTDDLQSLVSRETDPADKGNVGSRWLVELAVGDSIDLVLNADNNSVTTLLTGTIDAVSRNL